MFKNFLVIFSYIKFLLKGGINMDKIVDLYLSLIVAGRRTFSSIPTVYKQAVADDLIAIGRTDLIDDPAYLPQPTTEPTI
jgi:hypothetical protein